MLKIQVTILHSAGLMVNREAFDLETVLRLSQIVSIRFAIYDFCWLTNVSILHLVNEGVHKLGPVVDKHLCGCICLRGVKNFMILLYRIIQKVFAIN